jgi:hypothetical protein
MDVHLAALSDHALTDAHGKVSIIGLFSALVASQVPVSHPHMCMVIILQSNRSDADRNREWMVDVTDVDGKAIVPRMQGNVAFDSLADPPPQANFILGLQGIVFPDYGAYYFTIFVDGSEKKQLRLDVVKPLAGAE